MRRRRLLAVAVGTAAFAGCSGKSTPSPSPSPREFTDRFRTSLELAQSGIEDIRIREDGSVVHLRYETTAPEGASREEVSAAVETETADVASAFASVVGAGWEASKLAVTVEQGESVVATYYIRAEWAAAWNQGNATAAEYGENIRGTFRTATPASG